MTLYSVTARASWLVNEARHRLLGGWGTVVVSRLNPLSLSLSTTQTALSPQCSLKTSLLIFRWTDWGG